MSVKITCIKKDNGFHANPHIAISELGWINETTGKSGLLQGYRYMNLLKVAVKLCNWS